MEPPYTLTAQIVNYIDQISRLLGRLEYLSSSTHSPQLRRDKTIQTIQSTLVIEGHFVSKEQVTAVLEGKRVLGSKEDILAVKNAVTLYQSIQKFKPYSIQSLLKAHAILMDKLVDSAGTFRKKNVGILKGRKVAHVAPQPKLVPRLVEELFAWAKKEKELHLLVKSSVVHYELEFIHPFEDGNGRLGRFWQTVMLYQYHPLFQLLPIESFIQKNQEEYYEVLGRCDKKGESTEFLEFMLRIILQTIQTLPDQAIGLVINASDRISQAASEFAGVTFSRKEYMKLFPTISSATASRDLKEGVERGVFVKWGSGNATRYGVGGDDKRL